MGLPGQGPPGRDMDVRAEVNALVIRIEALLKDLRKVSDDDAGRQT